jgi:arylsulfatase A-like enzyme
MERWQLTYPQLLQKAGYETAVIGKWHLGDGPLYDPAGFDYWSILPGQGAYNNPEFIENGKRIIHKGHVTDIITNLSLSWLKQRKSDKPFCLLCHHKAAHRPWVPAPRHAHLYDDIEIPEPDTFNDDYSNRASVAAGATITISKDIVQKDVKVPIPTNLSDQDLKEWKYQSYIKDYLRCVAGIDESVSSLLAYLDAAGLAENTIVIYTSDQGFFLGDHGWYDKRFMYEESLRMPFIARFPREIPAGTVCSQMALNVDFAPTFLELAGLPIPTHMQGTSLRSLLQGKEPVQWRESMYYRYFMDDSAVNISPHYGVRTKQFKLIYYYGRYPSEWELFDLAKDPYEMNSVYHDREYADVVVRLKRELSELRKKLGDYSDPWVD